MKLYKTVARNSSATVTRWSASQAAAGKDRKTLISDSGFKRAEVSTDEVDVPSGKAGLIEFLNGLK